MAIRSPLETLIELAQRATDDAAKRLGAAIRALDEAEQKLQMLVGYRTDYALRFELTQAAGITPMAYRNYQAFLEKLDNAIRGQQEVVNYAKNKSGVEKFAWQDSERKRMSYTTLNNRAAQVALRAESKRDQKAMDEHAARQAYYRK